MTEYKYRHLPVWLVFLVCVVGIGVIGWAAFTGIGFVGYILAMVVIFGSLWLLPKLGMSEEHNYRANAEGLTIAAQAPGRAAQERYIPWNLISGLEVKTHVYRSQVDNTLVINLADGSTVNVRDQNKGFEQLVAAMQEFLPQLDYRWVPASSGWAKVQRG
ncbi:MAG: hypothetical protein ACM3XM_13840 [Mycobacterium leprae]